MICEMFLEVCVFRKNQPSVGKSDLFMGFVDKKKSMDECQLFPLMY